jgi:hypothetical protein
MQKPDHNTITFIKESNPAAFVHPILFSQTNREIKGRPVFHRITRLLQLSIFVLSRWLDFVVLLLVLDDVLDAFERDSG